MKKLEVDGESLCWNVTQNSEHSDLEIVYQGEQFFIQVELTNKDMKHNNKFDQGYVKYPIKKEKVALAFELLKEKGYLHQVKNKDVGFILLDNE